MKNCFKLRIISSNIKNSRNDKYAGAKYTICFWFIMDSEICLPSGILLISAKEVCFFLRILQSRDCTIVNFNV